MTVWYCLDEIAFHGHVQKPNGLIKQMTGTKHVAVKHSQTSSATTKLPTRADLQGSPSPLLKTGMAATLASSVQCQVNFRIPEPQTARNSMAIQCLPTAANPFRIPFPTPNSQTLCSVSNSLPRWECFPRCNASPAFFMQQYHQIKQILVPDLETCHVHARSPFAKNRAISALAAASAYLQPAHQ